MSLRIAHIITGLERGGAGMMLLKLLNACDRSKLSPAVITLMDKGTLGKQIENLGIEVEEVRMSRGRLTPASFVRLHRLYGKLSPDLIQGWMYHGNAAALIGRYALRPRVPIVWNIRHTLYDLKKEKPLTRWLIRFGSRTSGYPERIIYNSRIGAEQHEAIGYQPERRVVIPNGFDASMFKPVGEASQCLRSRLGLPPDTLVIGMVARYHPMKDHTNLIRAAVSLTNQLPDVHFLLIGREVDPNNATIKRQIEQVRMTDRFHLLGERTDMPELTAGLDVATLTSAWGEGFPNVIGEAMACGVPCVVTDVGDAGDIVGETGVVVPPNDPDALAAGWKRILTMDLPERVSLGRMARKRIEDHYSLDRISERYENLYLELIGRWGPRIH